MYIKPTRAVTIEHGMAKEILEICRLNMELADQNLGLIINMAKAAFVSEDARELLSGDGNIEQSISHLALVSDNHLSNVISALTVEHNSSDNVEMVVLKTAEAAVDWLQVKMNRNRVLEAAS